MEAYTNNSDDSTNDYPFDHKPDPKALFAARVHTALRQCVFKTGKAWLEIDSDLPPEIHTALTLLHRVGRLRMASVRRRRAKHYTIFVQPMRPHVVVAGEKSS
jgi:hypothetical protein